MKALSLTARLSLLFALSAIIVLLGFGWVVARSVEDHFLELDRGEIEGKLALVRNLLAKAHSPESLAALPQELDDALVGHPGLAVTLLAADGSTWFSTGGWQIPPPSGTAPIGPGRTWSLGRTGLCGIGA